MAGALEATGEPFASELLSYEGPVGVGYAVAAFEIEDAPGSTEEEAAAEIVREEDREIGAAPGGCAGLAAAPRRRPWPSWPSPGRAWSPSSRRAPSSPFPPTHPRS